MTRMDNVQCSYCRKLIDPWGGIDGVETDKKFKINCEECKKDYSMKFARSNEILIYEIE